ncbi:MAG: HD domain-containing protein [Candidatus Cloacimonetes bacterium]|nr:HD domain-containing protein [Candidatus Cloacimonadota bacterium]
MDKIEVKDVYQYLNQEIDIFLLLTKKELREGKKDYYIRLDFVDKSGHISGNVWNNALSSMDGYAEKDVVKVRALVTNYKEQIQLNVKKIRKANENEYELEDYIQKTKKDVNQLSKDFFSMIDSISEENIKKLLSIIFDDKEMWMKFSYCPAAKSWHHNYVGGLIEHTVSVMKICDFVSKMYPVNRDILIAGAILHDIGKVFEYTTLPSIEFSDEGRLIGHIVLGDQFVANKANEINLFPANLLMKLRHLIISHHGELEKGAVKVPQTLEAVILHFADNLDAQAIGTHQLMESAIDPKAQWTEYDKLNNRYIYLG